MNNFQRCTFQLFFPARIMGKLFQLGLWRFFVKKLSSSASKVRKSQEILDMGPLKIFWFFVWIGFVWCGLIVGWVEGINSVFFWGKVKNQMSPDRRGQAWAWEKPWLQFFSNSILFVRTPFEIHFLLSSFDAIFSSFPFPFFHSFL